MIVGRWDRSRHNLDHHGFHVHYLHYFATDQPQLKPYWKSHNLLFHFCPSIHFHEYEENSPTHSSQTSFNAYNPQFIKIEFCPQEILRILKEFFKKQNTQLRVFNVPDIVRLATTYMKSSNNQLNFLNAMKFNEVC